MEINNLDDFTKLVNSCRKLGVKSLKDGEFSLELAPDALFPESEYRRNKKAKETEKIKEPVSDPIAEAERAMFWSSDQSPIVGAPQ